MSQKRKLSESSASLHDDQATQATVDRLFDESIEQSLADFIKIPNVSPLYDPGWAENGLQEKAFALLQTWTEKQGLLGTSIELITLPELTPMLVVEVAASNGDAADAPCTLLYGHCDKQPPMDADWDEGLGPYLPVRRGDKLFGRGGADDGYALFTAVAAVKALQEQKLAHPRYLILIEGSEESGSKHLPHYVEHLAPRIGSPAMVVCLDSGCGDYERFWMTASLRGIVVGELTCSSLTQGVHSGAASGIVPDSFRLCRQLISRLEDPVTGAITADGFYDGVSKFAQEKLQETARVLGDSIKQSYPWVAGAQPMADTPEALLAQKTWRPALSITGQAGLPNLEVAGNVLRPFTTLTLSLRLPPNVNSTDAAAKLKTLLEANPPYGARVELKVLKHATGWTVPEPPKWLEEACDAASRAYFAQPSCYIGEGGSIPFMNMLKQKFPKANFLVCGLLGPGSNAHGGNESLDVPYARKLTMCVAKILHQSAQH